MNICEPQSRISISPASDCILVSLLSYMEIYFSAIRKRKLAGANGILKAMVEF